MRMIRSHCGVSRSVRSRCGRCLRCSPGYQGDRRFLLFSEICALRLRDLPRLREPGCRRPRPPAQSLPGPVPGDSGEEWLLRNTWYPREAKRRAMLRPMPREEPVMRMVFRAMNVPPLSAGQRKGISPDPDIIIITDNHCYLK